MMNLHHRSQVALMLLVWGCGLVQPTAAAFGPVPSALVVPSSHDATAAAASTTKGGAAAAAATSSACSSSWRYAKLSTRLSNWAFEREPYEPAPPRSKPPLKLFRRFSSRAITAKTTMVQQNNPVLRAWKSFWQGLTEKLQQVIKEIKSSSSTGSNQDVDKQQSGLLAQLNLPIDIKDMDWDWLVSFKVQPGVTAEEVQGVAAVTALLALLSDEHYGPNETFLIVSAAVAFCFTQGFLPALVRAAGYLAYESTAAGYEFLKEFGVEIFDKQASKKRAQRQEHFMREMLAARLQLEDKLQQQQQQQVQTVADAPSSIPQQVPDHKDNVLTEKEAPVVVKSQAVSPPRQTKKKKKKKRAVRLRPKKQSKSGSSVVSGQPQQVVASGRSAQEYKGLVRGSDVSPKPKQDDDPVAVTGVSPKTKGRLRRFFSFRRAKQEPSTTTDAPRRLLSDTELLETLQTKSINGNNNEQDVATKRKQLPPEQEQRIQQIALREEQIRDLGGARPAVVDDDDEEEETSMAAVDDKKNHNNKRRLGLVGRLFRRRRNRGDQKRTQQRQ